MFLFTLCRFSEHIDHCFFTEDELIHVPGRHHELDASPRLFLGDVTPRHRGTTGTTYSGRDQFDPPSCRYVHFWGMQASVDPPSC